MHGIKLTRRRRTKDTCVGTEGGTFAPNHTVKDSVRTAVARQSRCHKANPTGQNVHHRTCELVSRSSVVIFMSGDRVDYSELEPNLFLHRVGFGNLPHLRHTKPHGFAPWGTHLSKISRVNNFES